MRYLKNQDSRLNENNYISVVNVASEPFGIHGD